MDRSTRGLIQHGLRKMRDSARACRTGRCDRGRRVASGLLGVARDAATGCLDGMQAGLLRAAAAEDATAIPPSIAAVAADCTRSRRKGAGEREPESLGQSELAVAPDAPAPVAAAVVDHEGCNFGQTSGIQDQPRQPGRTAPGLRKRDDPASRLSTQLGLGRRADQGTYRVNLASLSGRCLDDTGGQAGSCRDLRAQTNSRC